MDIEMVAARVFEGENETRSLQIEVEEAWRAYEIRLAFVSPAGRRYLTAPITLSGGTAVYALPAAVLDARGILLAQIVAAGENARVVKSRVFRFEVERSVRCEEAAAPDGTLITLGGVYADVQSLWETLENEYATMADIPVAVSELENDAGYISASEVESALSAISEVPVISTDISADATSDTKTASPKAVKTYVDTTAAAIRPPKLGSCYVSADLKSGSSTAFEGTNIYYELAAGGYIAVYFQQDVPANATLEINGKGDVELYYGADEIGANVIKAGDTATFVCSIGQIVKYILVAVDRITVPEISTNISTDASSDTKTASPKAVKTYVDAAIPTVPTISTNISEDAFSDTKTASPKAVITYVDLGLSTKQSKLYFDSTPLNGSTNPVTSDGVYNAIPAISTSISSDASSDVKTASPKAVKDYVDAAISGAIGGSY